MNYQVDQFYTFPVLDGKPDDDFFSLQVQSNDGPAIVTLNKLQFQKDPKYKQPLELECRVRSIDSDGIPVLSHAIANYVSELYAKAYSRGESFECTVTTVPTNPAEEPYSVRDNYGIFYRIQETEEILTLGQKIRCKIKMLAGKRFEIKRIDEKSKLPFIKPEDLLEGVHPTSLRLAKIIVLSPRFENVRAEILANKGQWPLTAAAIVRDNLDEWFVFLRCRRLTNILSILVADIKKTLLYLLEGSNYLNALPSEQRRAYQQLLTEHVEALDPYNTALRLLDQHCEDKFVEGLFDKLQRSGYLYHPLKQFAVLMLVFRIYPHKVSSYLNRIFESIFTRDLDNWKREPFRSAFFEQFQIYVRQARREIDVLPIAEKREQKLRLETIITALALEILLADQEDIRRTRSLFYRYISLLRPLSSEVLLTKSFIALLGGNLPSHLKYSTLREPMMMMTQASIMPEGPALSRLNNSFRYTNGIVDFNISHRGLTLSRTIDSTIDPGMLERAIPDGFLPWLNPQIYINGVKSLSASKIRSLSDHNIWWKEIENALFDCPSFRTDEPELHAAEIGDLVWIVVDSISDPYSNDPTFLCHIQHEGLVESKGYIKRSSIVSYNLRQPDISIFRTPGGAVLGFEAKITGIDPNGMYVFSLLDAVRDFSQNMPDYKKEYIAVITGNTQQGYSSIGREGIGLYLRDDLHPDRELAPGTVVHYKCISSSRASVIGYITDTSVSDEDRFDKLEAFANLLAAIGVPDESTSSEESIMDDSFEFLSSDNVREIIEIIRFHAIANTDLIQAFDYLRFARILALSIGDSTLADRLLTHTTLLNLHQYYATNSRIDTDDLEKVRILTQGDPFLNQIFTRLEIVSWLGNSDHNDALFSIVQNPSTELEGSLAKMVLSYNMLQSQADGADDSVMSALKSNIMLKLNVNSQTNTGTYYGSESKYVEFKTSLVNVATAPGQPLKVDPTAQQAHILSRIAGMLNANGGTIYIGVNDDGYAVGLRDDFKYYQNHKLHIGTYSYQIKTLDNLCVFLENLVNHAFGETIARKIEIAVDDKADKDVIVISIEESLTPVFLDGRLHVRQSGQSTYEYSDQVKKDEFLAEREQKRLEKQYIAAIAQAETLRAKVENDKIVTPSKNPAVEESIVEETSDYEIATTPTIKTSHWRPNVLHNYEDGYNEPVGYIYFTGDNTLMFSTQDLYMENDPGTRLVLAIPHDLKDGSLILGFENERAVRVPLSEIYERGENNEIRHNHDFKLDFAAVAGKDDLLLVMAADNSNTVWRRAFPLAHMDAAHLTSVPRRLNESPTAYTVAWEIVDRAASENFDSCRDEKLSGKRFGETMRAKAGSPEWLKKYEQEVDKCHIG